MTSENAENIDDADGNIMKAIASVMASVLREDVLSKIQTFDDYFASHEKDACALIEIIKTRQYRDMSMIYGRTPCEVIGAIYLIYGMEYRETIGRYVTFIENFEPLERNFRQLFMDIEGNYGCADKAGTLMNFLGEFYLTGKHIDFSKRKANFNVPQKILKEHDEIVEFADAFIRLQYGYSENYINVMQKYIEMKKP